MVLLLGSMAEEVVSFDFIGGKDFFQRLFYAFQKRIGALDDEGLGSEGFRFIIDAIEEMVLEVSLVQSYSHHDRQVVLLGAVDVGTAVNSVRCCSRGFPSVDTEGLFKGPHPVLRDPGKTE